MKKLKSIFPFILILISLSCSENSNLTDAPYVPQIENIWHDKQNKEHTFSFSTSDENVSHGLFTGFEEYPDSNIFNSELYGVFTNRTIEFNVRRFEGEVKFKGTIQNDTTIDLTYRSGRITLIKGQ